MDVLREVVDYLAAHNAAVAALVGIILPAVTAVVQRPAWSKTLRTGVAVVVAAAAGFVTAAATGAITDPSDLLMTFVIVYTAGEAAYEKLWQPSGAAQIIERFTSPSKQVTGDEGGI